MFIAGRFIRPLYLALIAVVVVSAAVAAAFSFRGEPAAVTAPTTTASPSPEATLGGQLAQENTSNARPESEEDESDIIRPVRTGDATIDFPFLASANVQEIRPKDLPSSVAYAYAMHPEDWNILLPKYRAELATKGWSITKETALNGGAGAKLDVTAGSRIGQVWLRTAPSDVDDNTILIAQFKSKS
jgi:hypothetical protein